MKEYLLLFRDQAFNGAFALFKRVLISNILITIILSIVGLACVFPLILKGIGWSIADVVDFQDKIKNLSKNIKSPDELGDYFMNMMGPFNYGFLAAAFAIAILFSAYQYVVFFKLNDNEVRNGNTGIADALKASFNRKVFSMIGLYIATSLLISIVIIAYIFLLVILYMGSAVLAVILGFILFFVVAIFIIRSLIAPAAMIHGNLVIFDSIAYSFKKITWKRAGILFMMGLVFLIATGMVTGIAGGLTGAIFGLGNTNTTAFVITQIISSAFGAVISAFFYCSLSAIYFRYSNDMKDDGINTTVEEHLIS